jgi:phosphatidylinositol alpha-1,6-mannosyltransferase
LSAFLLLTPVLSGRDGISEVSRQIARGLVDRAGAAAVETWALDGEAPAAADRLAAHQCRVAGGRRRQLLGWTMRRAMSRADGLTVVVMHAHLSPLAFVLALRGARIIMFLHGIEVWRPLRLRERLAFLFAECVVANSERTAARFRAANPWWGDRAVRVALLGVGAPVDRPVPPATRGFALIVGRIAADERYKGHDALIDAWPAVVAALPHAQLIIVGDGSDRARLERRVKDSGLGSIRFVGPVSDAELRGWYQACDCFVMPSGGEGFGLAYLEAMREGKPCIALRSADEIVGNDVTGVLVEDQEPTALAQALVRLMSDAPLRRRLGDAATARVTAEFTEERFFHRFCNAIGLESDTARPSLAKGARARA